MSKKDKWFLSYIGCFLLVSVVFLGWGLFVSLTNLYAGPPTNPQTPTIVDTAALPGFNTDQVSMNGTAKVICAAPATGHSRGSVIIYNPSDVTLYIGKSTVTTSTGFPIPAGASVVLDRTYAAIYGVITTGTATVSYIEEAR